MVSGIIDIQPIWRALGKEKAQAIPIFHAFTGTDNVGKFSGISKTKWFQQYMKADVDLPRALLKLPVEGDLTQEVKDALEKFVCLKYCPKGVRITSIPDLRWHLLCKQLAESNKLPPTLGALEEHINRVHLQSWVWHQATVMQQQPFEPLQFGYSKERDGQLFPVTTLVLPAPQAIIELVRCQCKTNCSTLTCSCRHNNLPCTELCWCDTDVQCTNNEDCNIKMRTVTLIMMIRRNLFMPLNKTVLVIPLLMLIINAISAKHPAFWDFYHSLVSFLDFMGVKT